MRRKDSTTRRRLALAAAVAAACISPTIGPASAASIKPACANLVFSPTFAADRTVFCQVSGPVYYRSSDGGHTWAGPYKVADIQRGPMIALSPWFNRDHTMWAATDTTIWVSHDAGAHFAVLDTVEAAGLGDQLLHPFVVPADPTGPARVALLAWSESVIGGPNGTEYVEVNGQMEKLPMLGAPDAYVLDYFTPPNVSPTNPPMALSAPAVSDSDQTPVATPVATAVQIRSCDALFECTAVHFATPIGKVDPGTFDQLGSPGSYLIAVSDDTGHYYAYRTSDYGGTWSRWPSLERLLTPTGTGDCPSGSFCEAPTIFVTQAPDAPRKVFVLIEDGNIDENSTPTDLAAERTPDLQLFRSDDGGEHWRQIGRSYLPGQRLSPRSNMPFNYSAFELHAESGHRLYLIGDSVTHLHPTKTAYSGMWCSTNDGATWHTSC